MEFNILQNKIMENVARYENDYGVTFTKELAALKLTEELGEFAQALIVHNKQSRPSKHMAPEESKQLVAKELADILGILVLNARLHNINLEEALEQKWLYGLDVND